MTGESIGQVARGWIGVAISAAVLILSVTIAVVASVEAASSFRADIRIVQASLATMQQSMSEVKGSVDTLTAAVHDRWTGSDQKEWEKVYYLPLRERVRELELACRE